MAKDRGNIGRAVGLRFKGWPQSPQHKQLTAFVSACVWGEKDDQLSNSTSRLHDLGLLRALLSVCVCVYARAFGQHVCPVYDSYSRQST